MTVLSAQAISRAAFVHDLITPFHENKGIHNGMSYGLTAAGYDIRIGSFLVAEGSINAQIVKEGFVRLNPGDFVLGASLERFIIPPDLQAIVHDKSTWARRGLALQNTVLEPGWVGYITLELSNHGRKPVDVYVGDPIAQVVFHKLDHPTNRPYKGKYQNQSDRPTPAIHEPQPFVIKADRFEIVNADFGKLEERVILHMIVDRCKRAAADKMGLRNDPEGRNLPLELWKQMIPTVIEGLGIDALKLGKELEANPTPTGKHQMKDLTHEEPGPTRGSCTGAGSDSDREAG